MTADTKKQAFKWNERATAYLNIKIWLKEAIKQSEIGAMQHVRDKINQVLHHLPIIEPLTDKEPDDAEMIRAVDGAKYAFDCVVNLSNALENQTVIVRADHLKTLITAASRQPERLTKEQFVDRMRDKIEHIARYSNTWATALSAEFPNGLIVTEGA